MNRNLILKMAAGLMAVLAISLSAQTPVAKHGKLSTSGGYLLDQNGDIVQLRGMSFYWSTPSWPGYKYYTAATVNALVDSWKCTVVRIAYDRNNGNDNGWDGVKTVLDAAIAKGIYAIIDWHSHTAQDQQAAAVSKFTEWAQAYKNVPNVIFEPYNEPITYDGSTTGTQDVAIKTWAQIKPYFKAVIQAIRDQGAENLVIIGTPFYSQFVGVAAGDPPLDKNNKPFTNVAYAFHFYAASHGPYATLVKGTGKGGMEPSYLEAGLGQVPVFISEWGTTDNLGGQGGNNTVDEANTNWWFSGNSSLGGGGGYVNGKYHLSWCNWSVSDFQASSAFTSGSVAPNLNPSTSGAIVKRLLTSESTDTYANPAKAGLQGPANDTVFSMPATHQFYRYNRYYGSVSAATISFANRDTVDKRTATQGITLSSTGSWCSFFMNFSSSISTLYVRYLLKTGSAAADVYVNSTKVGSLNFASGTYWQTVGLNATIPSGKDTLKFVFTSVPSSGFYIEWLSNTPTNTSTVTIQRNFSLGDAKVSLFKAGFAVKLPISHEFTNCSLIGANGRVINSTSISRETNEMHFNDLSNGVWFIKLEGANGAKLYKAVVSR
jgi:endoglucanase